MRRCHFFKKIGQYFKAKTLLIKTHLLKVSKSSDYYRWANPENLKDGWDERTILIANLIEDGKTVLEFGAGRLVLKNHLKASCTYIPSDIVDRGVGTIVCDLNKELPKIPNVDVIIFSGVLEYIHELKKLIAYLSKKTNSFIFSYAVTDYYLNGRRRHGWVNDYSKEELISFFGIKGFSLKHLIRWENQLIFKFEKD